MSFIYKELIQTTKKNSKIPKGDWTNYILKRIPRKENTNGKRNMKKLT